MPGVFATATGHILSTKPEEKPRLDANDLFVDVGAESREEAESLGDGFVEIQHTTLFATVGQKHD